MEIFSINFIQQFFICSFPFNFYFFAEENGSDFETAIASTGYGKFNFLLLLIAFPCCTSSVFETTSMSLILPSAECILNLSLVDKGILNAVTYAGKLIVKNSFTMWFVLLCIDLNYKSHESTTLSYFSSSFINVSFLFLGMISSAILWGFLSGIFEINTHWNKLIWKTWKWKKKSL